MSNYQTNNYYNIVSINHIINKKKNDMINWDNIDIINKKKMLLLTLPPSPNPAGIYRWLKTLNIKSLGSHTSE